MLTNIIPDSYKIIHGLNIKRVQKLMTQLFVSPRHVLIILLRLVTLRSAVDIIPLLCLPVSVWGRGSVMSPVIISSPATAAAII